VIEDEVKDSLTAKRTIVEDIRNKTTSELQILSEIDTMKK